ncbi:hypothetical protein HMPREF9135_0250 [Segatella baroniae F0067]|uniref:Uncharacterized protein n=1 Tax=Segatella baroniae F0067 TaxID=1115809 RepID=U2QF99_9BACT|nr:hypothetical protein HMPREF9135_0250 [Segatella baroniae F0067]
MPVKGLIWLSKSMATGFPKHSFQKLKAQRLAAESTAVRP